MTDDAVRTAAEQCDRCHRTDDAVKAADGRAAVLREELGRVLAELLKASAEAVRAEAALARVATEAASYRAALEEADHVLGRLSAPCPQCHTLGYSPGCLTVTHALTNEALHDIRNARDIARAALDGEEQG